jgi:hypothetical protein
VAVAEHITLQQVRPQVVAQVAVVLVTAPVQGMSLDRVLVDRAMLVDKGHRVPQILVAAVGPVRLVRLVQVLQVVLAE